MSSATKQAAFRRIVVGLHASGYNQPALETAVRLAAALGAELEGVFIEDVNLMRLAGLPFLREVRLWSLAEEALSSQRMERELRALARRAEQMLVQAVGETGVRWSFRVWRGRTEAASLIASFDADVWSLARVGSLASYAMRPDYKAHARTINYPVTPISVLFRSSEQAAKALYAACHLAKDLDALITVWLPKLETNVAKDLQEKVGNVLNAHTQRARFVELTDLSVHTLAKAVNASRSTVLIAAAGDPLLQQKGLSQCLEALSCPLLLVR